MKAKAKANMAGGAERARKELEAQYAAFAAQLEAWHDELSRRPTRTMLVSVPAAVYKWLERNAEALGVNPGEVAARIVRNDFHQSRL